MNPCFLLDLSFLLYLTVHILCDIFPNTFRYDTSLAKYY